MESKSKRPDKGWREPVWERQEGESTRAFQGFAAYRDLGPARSIAQTARNLSKSKQGTLGPWSVIWGWVERAAAWDDQADRLARERDIVERQEAIRKMRENHAKAGAAMQQVAGAAMQRFSGDQPTAKKALSELTAGDIARLMETGTKLELRARGEATERIEMRDAVAWVEGFVDVALGYVPIEAHDAFLSDVKAKMGAGAG